MSESQIVHNDREEFRALRDAEDMGGTRRINGVRYDDWPSEGDCERHRSPTRMGQGAQGRHHRPLARHLHQVPRRHHPRPAHRARQWRIRTRRLRGRWRRVNECDQCGRDLGANQGGLCDECAEHYLDDMPGGDQ